MLNDRALRLLKADPTEKDIDWSDPKWAVEAVMPELTARDTTTYAAALQQVVVAVALAIEKSLMTEATALKLINAIAGRLGVEFDAEAELTAAREEASKRAEKDVFTEPPATGEPAPDRG
jgi:hypothetical protein